METRTNLYRVWMRGNRLSNLPAERKSRILEGGGKKIHDRRRFQAFLGRSGEPGKFFAGVTAVGTFWKRKKGGW